MKKRKLVLIKWEDSILGYSGWKVIEDEPKRRSLFYSVGFVIHEDKNSITLYSDIEITKDEKQSGARDLIIPKSAIRKIKVVKK